MVTFVIAGRPNSNRIISLYSREFVAASVRPQLRLKVWEGEEAMEDWAGFPVDDQGNVDTMSALGVISIGSEPWVWSENFGAYFYLRESSVTDKGIWAFAVQTTEENHFPSEGGWNEEFDTGSFLGVINTSLLPWLYARDNQSFVYISLEHYTAGHGAWLFLPFLR